MNSDSSNVLENVQAHPPLGARANVENGVEAESTTDAAEQKSSLRLDAASCSDSFCEECGEKVGPHGIKFVDLDNRERMYRVCSRECLGGFTRRRNDKRYSGLVEVWDQMNNKYQWNHIGQKS